MNKPVRNCDPTLSLRKHTHSPEEEAQIRDAALDETLEDTFPASDPPSTIPNPDLHEALCKDEEDTDE
jgi:hypothetical protein